MILQDMLSRIKPQPQNEEVELNEKGEIESFSIFRNLFLSIVIILVASLSFGIGRLSVVGKREPIKIEYDPEISNSQIPISNETFNTRAQMNQSANVISSLKNEVVVSKNGARYHYPHCSGAKQIKEENKIIFATPAAAEAAGYILAANCKPR